MNSHAEGVEEKSRNEEAQTVSEKDKGDTKLQCEDIHIEVRNSYKRSGSERVGLEEMIPFLSRIVSQVVNTQDLVVIRRRLQQSHKNQNTEGHHN